MPFYVEKWHKKFEKSRSTFSWLETGLKFWLHLHGKTCKKKQQQNAIFQNWLKTHPKTETHEPNVYPTILGGVSRGFWTPFLDWGAQSAIFWRLKTGTFAKSARFQVPKNGTSDAETKKPRPLFVANYPPKWYVARLFCAFSIFGWVLGQFWKIAFFSPFLTRFTL